ncbi:YjbH domain-containing protein [Colwellia sp. BRX8-4]|uniref:YjbH domain-containing protein n=1 Tax=Colwellia sp. BRX8-4 TaxID=2759836 RepID=UPI0015F440DA|nr:YjbH domain-containing protein [Colwellia sp. BRX8-4]MBA6370476.1 YjbH domain-containing protein [Colwellia sp. BRX8-4]
MKHRILFVLALLPCFITAAEPEATMSFQGYSGLINTPTATLFDEGTLYLKYSNQVETIDGYRNGDNYNFGVGLWKYVEVSARLADYQAPNGGNSPTDLSANIKIGIPFIPKDWFSLAVGIQDLGGAANYFDAKYAVATKNILEDVNISLGIGQSDSNQGRLDGVFAGVEWQPYQWVKLSAEYDAADTQLGMHLSSPKQWLSSGIQLTTELLISSSNEALKDDVYYGIGLTIPLDYDAGTHSSQPKRDPINHGKVDSELEQTGEYVALAINDVELDDAYRSGALERLQLRKLLVKEGFESIRVVEADVNTVYVELEDHLYNRNKIDGLGVILGIISKNIHHNYSYFTLVLKEQEISTLVVKGSIAEYDAFLRDDKPLKIDISTDTFATERLTSEDADNSNNFWLKPRFTFWPGIASRVGTELGVFDASVALISHVELPLWPGAALTAAHVAQFAETKNFEDGQYFADDKQTTGLKEYSFHQTFSLPYSVKNMTFFGRYRDTYNYVANEARWQSVAGAHKLNLFTARYENQLVPTGRAYAGCNILALRCRSPKEPEPREVLIGTYKYYNAHLNATAELQVGKYWQRDKGLIFKVERMFGDVSLNLTYKNTKIDGEEANQFIGLGFSIPLTPRKDYNNKYFQVRGKPKWNYSVSTLVGKNHNRLTPGTGDNTKQFYNLDSAFYNHDRLGSEYIYENSSRLKEAYYQAR